MRLKYIVAPLLIIAASAGFTFQLWRDWLDPKEPEAAASHEPDNPVERVRLSPQARANLKLRIGKAELAREPYWRAVQVPGWVVERQGSCERLVAAPLHGVVKQIAAVRGDLLRPGAPLFTLQIVSEPILSAQSNLYKTERELDIVRAEKSRLAQLETGGAIPMARIIEIDNQIARLNMTSEACQRELAARGLSAADVEHARKGKFVQEIAISVPVFTGATHDHAADSGPALTHERLYELEELKVMLGEIVPAGAPLCVLADHYHLQIEGRVFASEATLIQGAAKNGAPIRAIFTGEADKGWPAFDASLKITNVANRVDPNHQTLSFFLPLPNQFQEYERNHKTYRLWRFRPGQRVNLKVPVEAYTDVFVLPAEAVVHEGVEAFIFRVNGQFFEKRPVHVVHEDRAVALVAHDGSIFPGLDMLALNAAVQINWALKAQAPSAGGAHDHGGH